MTDMNNSTPKKICHSINNQCVQEAVGTRVAIIFKVDKDFNLADFIPR